MVAKRGEIAGASFAIAHEMAIPCVAKFDTHALHVELADEAVRIGEDPSGQTRLSLFTSTQRPMEPLNTNLKVTFALSLSVTARMFFTVGWVGHKIHCLADV